MLEEVPFAELIRRVRAGDQEAAAELVRQCEPEVRTQVHIWLVHHDRELCTALDSADICQAVLKSFFVRVALGDYELDRRDDLIALLVTMARHKLSEQRKHHHSKRRDVRRTRSLAPEHQQVAARGVSPSDIVAGEELLREVQSRLSEEERKIAELRAEGLEWVAVANRLGGTSEGRRKQLARAIGRVLEELGLDE
jgi:RNA polymerase sigma factor (sigma-70 family)